MNRSRNINNKVYTDIGICIGIITILLMGVLLDKITISSLPKWLLIDGDMRENLKLYVFSAQVSISTLGIALIAIVGGLFKENIYGINVLKYVTNDKPIILKHKTIITIQLIMIFISYVFTALNDYYNTLISIFMISIILNILMVRDIFSMYKGNEYLKNEIYNYIQISFKKGGLSKKHLKQNIIIELKNDILLNLRNGNIYIVIENLDLICEILRSISSNKHKNKNDIVVLFEKNMSDIFDEILQNSDPNIVMIGLEKIQSLYQLCNEHNDTNENKLYLNIYDKVEYRMSISTATILLKNIDNKYATINFLHDLYDNMYFEKINNKVTLINNVQLKYYSQGLYYEIKQTGFEKYDEEILYNVKKKLFTNIEREIHIFKYDKFKIKNTYQHKYRKINEMYIHLFKYTKALIDNNEEKVLKNIFFNTIGIPNDSVDDKDMLYRFIVIIYIYYLANSDAKLTENIKILINNNSKDIKSFLVWNREFKFSSEKIKQMKYIFLKENLPYQNRLPIENIIKEFLLLFVLYRSEDSENVKIDLMPLYELKLISKIDYEYKDEILIKYKKFKNLFYQGQITNEEITNKSSILKMLR